MSSSSGSEIDAMDGQSGNKTGANLSLNWSEFPDHIMQRSLATYKYENALLKTELAATLECHGKELQELHLKCQAEVKEAINNQEVLKITLEQSLNQLESELHKVHQTNLQLQQKLKLTAEDLEESMTLQLKYLREKKDLEENYEKKVNKHEDELNNLKVDKFHLTETCDQLRGDLEKEKSSARELKSSLSNEQHQHQLKKSRLADVEQQCQIQLVSAKLEIAQIRKDKDQENANSTKKIDGLMDLLEKERSTSVQLKEQLVSRQLELEAKLASQRQTRIAEACQLTQRNSQLQERIKNLESRINSYKSNDNFKIDELDRDINMMTEKLHSEQLANAVLQTKLSELSPLEEFLRQEREISSRLKQELCEKKEECEHLNGVTLDLQWQLDEFKIQISNYKLNEEDIRKEAIDNRNKLNCMMTDQRAAHQVDMSEIRSRMSALQSQMQEKNKEYLVNNNNLSQKVKTYGNLIKKLRHKLEIKGLQLEQFEAEQVALRENIPTQTYRKLQHKFKVVTRKHKEFEAFLKGFHEFQTTLPEIEELAVCAEAVGRKLSELDKDQINLLTGLESL